MIAIKSHLLTEPVKHNLLAMARYNKTSNNKGEDDVSYPYFVAFISLLSNIELIKKIYLNATNGSRTVEVTKGKNNFRILKVMRILTFHDFQFRTTSFGNRLHLESAISIILLTL